MASMFFRMLFMSFPQQLAALRKHKRLTQPMMAELIGIHVSQYKRYEAGTSQPTLEVFKKIVEALNVSADSLLFDENEKQITEDKLKLQFEAISKMPEDQRRVIKELIDGMIIKYEAQRWQSHE